MYTLPKARQSILNEVQQYLEIMQPKSTATNLEQAFTFAHLNQYLVYLTNIILKNMGREQTLDIGEPWFIPYDHPHIYAVRRQHSTPYTSWQVQQHLDRTKSIATYIYVDDMKETLHIKVTLDEPQLHICTTQILSIELRYPNIDSSTHILVRNSLIYRTDNTNGQRENLADSQAAIPLPDQFTEFWRRDPSKALFG